MVRKNKESRVLVLPATIALITWSVLQVLGTRVFQLFYQTKISTRELLVGFISLMLVLGTLSKYIFIIWRVFYGIFSRGRKFIVLQQLKLSLRRISQVAMLVWNCLRNWDARWLVEHFIRIPEMRSCLRIFCGVFLTSNGGKIRSQQLARKWTEPFFFIIDS